MISLDNSTNGAKTMKDIFKNDRILSLIDLAEDMLGLLALVLFVIAVAAVGAAFTPEALPV
jgi:hypothetical protein